MGRSDATQVILEVNQRCRFYLPNLAISYSGGWEKRGNGQRANYEFGNVHHTGSATSLARPFPTQGLLEAGRSDLSGPLTNYATPACTVDAPRLHVVAANPANHAGASRASGPVPARSLYNPLTLGNEIDYAGSVAMLEGQMLVARVWARAVADVLGGGDVEHVRAHAETSITGKWDPGYAPGRTINMTEFRAAARNLTPQSQEDPLSALTDAEQRKLYNDVSNLYAAMFVGGPSMPYGVPLTALIDDLPRRTVNGVWLDTVVHRQNPDGTPLDVPVLQELADTKTGNIALAGQVAGLQAALNTLAAGKPIDGQAIGNIVRDATREALAAGTVHVEVKVAGPTEVESPS